MNSGERSMTTPEEVMREVTVDIIRRAIPMAKRAKRTISISKTARGKGMDVTTLDPGTAEGAQRLNAFLTPVQRHYTFSGLGAPEEPDAINWRAMCLPHVRRPPRPMARARCTRRPRRRR